MSVSERIKIFIQSLNYSNRQFAMNLNLSVSSFNRYMNGESDVLISVITKILDEYPQLNAEWLMRGKGEMLNIRIELPELTISYIEHMELSKKLNETQQKLIECMEKKVEPNKVVPGSIPPSYKRT